jgi:hypothetical protein
LADRKAGSASTELGSTPLASATRLVSVVSSIALVKAISLAASSSPSFV